MSKSIQIKMGKEYWRGDGVFMAVVWHKCLQQILRQAVLRQISGMDSC